MMFAKLRRAVWEFSVRYACPVWQANINIGRIVGRVIGGETAERIERKQVVAGYKLVLDTIECLPPDKQARWDVREIRALTESLVADMENPYISRRGEAQRRATLLKKIEEWNQRTDYGRRD